MPVTVELIKSDLLEQLQHIARQRLEAARADLACQFIRGMYEHVPPGDLVKERPEHLYAAALSLLGFAKHRAAGRPEIRIYTPRLDEHGWQSPHTVVEIITDDMPFLVDSVTAELLRLEAEVALFVHPMFSVRRDDSGELQAMGENAEQSKGSHESFMQVHVRAQPPDRFDLIRARLVAVLADVRVSVQDFAAMRGRCDQLVKEFENDGSASGDDTLEALEFLRWLNQDNFTYIGYRHCMFHPQEGSLVLRARCIDGLGILRNPNREVFEGFQPPNHGELLRIFKANERSTVHRPVHYDAIVLPDRSTDNESSPERGVHLFIGLFTLSAYSRSPNAIPLLRHKIASTVARSGLSIDGHDAKALHYILETYPRDELFQISIDNLLAIALGILHLQGRPRVALFIRRDPFNRFVSCLVYLPRDRLDTTLRLEMQALLARAFLGTISAYYTHLTDEPLARLLIIVKTPTGTPALVDLPALERKLQDVTRSWEDRLQAALVNELGEERGSVRARAYQGTFPTSYRERFDSTTAASDIEFVEHALEDGEFKLHLYRRVEAEPNSVCLKIFNPTGFLQLSDVLPMLENMGLRIISEVPYELKLPGVDAEVWLHDFSMRTDGDFDVDVGAVRDNFIEVFGAALKGELENDGFNRLVLHAGFGVREVRLIRAYAKYLRQICVPFSLHYMETTLRRNARITKMLVDLFAIRLHPPPASGKDAPGTSGAIAADVILNEIVARLDAVRSLDEDRILRRFLSAIQATVRTNVYQKDDNGNCKDYIALKFDSRKIEDLPEPRPFREVFVFSPRVEGVHLRFGAVARGGLRWSDRLEDFRTEVLGLVKAQRVKNAVIVPVGSKGGFVLKRPPPHSAGRAALVEEGIACYQTFIRGLLDVTDNREGDAIVPPKDVVRLDPPDPYLVVAADKGTATFSDIANAISRKYGFWLDDAFASGGSNGYDHKKMGITARGTWESVKRHFRELGRDIQRSTFTVVGVGDMSGDVFGNGMLLSEHTCLIAAFNHMHIFIDPDPDPASSFAERRRLFELPGSSWADYNRALISEGGGVYERGAKWIELSERAREVLDLRSANVTPSELISQILRAPLDLLFFGGIGTYVKASDETHAESGDRANDGLRVDARQLRVKVVGEGANLGMTQRARIEYALAGGRCNTDFIDNSAGVDCSDHEVNIKILLGEVERAGDLTRKQRDRLLQAMTDEVAQLVLRDNYLQTQALTVTQQIGVRYTDRLARCMKALERAGILHRELESLPDQETLMERVHKRVGFSRPELCVLLCYEKNALYEELLDSDLPDDPFLEADLVGYFPTALQDRFPEWIKSHRLRREIIATVVSNGLINRAGLTFTQEVSERTGMPAPRIAGAYVAARDIHRMGQLWETVEALDNQASAAAQASILMDAGRLLLATTTWLLRIRGLNIDINQLIVEYQPGVADLAERLDTLLGKEEKSAALERARKLEAEGVPSKVAAAAAKLPILVCACDVVSVSRRIGRQVGEVASLYFRVGERFGFDWLRRTAVTLPTERAWDKQAVAAIVDELYTSQRQLVASMLSGHHGAVDSDDVVAKWIELEQPLVTRTQQLLSELKATPIPDLAMLAVANRQLSAMISGDAAA
jgi:glutamate dehydrogenase